MSFLIAKDTAQQVTEKVKEIIDRAMKKHAKFRSVLAAFIICIIGFNFISISGDFFLNPFYILSVVTAVILIIKSINYTCPNCEKNQVIRSFLSYRMPKEKCYSCGSLIDEKDD